MTEGALLKKYDIQAPRYTSYPTVPYWSTTPSPEQWIHALRNAFDRPAASWSLYVHVPFCETLCTFCGCNTTITRDHRVGHPYVDRILQEFENYAALVPALRTAPLRQIHLGGGSPTFLRAEEMRQLVEGLQSAVGSLESEFEGAIEVDPRRTTVDQLKVLFDLGFRRVSLGVQDFNEDVQKVVNRVQSFERTRNVTVASRELGYDSVNFDLIYGLPKQTIDSFAKTAELTVALRPDRIALYSFAMVPWIKPAQRLFRDDEVPQGDEKRALYEVAHDLLTDAGYIEIGMDHFALPTDALYKADQEGRLHRNFMGYTDQKTDVLLGLGVSSISETPTCFHQNEKVLPVYERRVTAGEIPGFRGHLLTEEDQLQRDLILKFMTRFEVEMPTDDAVQDAASVLQELISDELVRIDGRRILLTRKGRPFLRNACMALDLRLRRSKPDSRVFSKAL